MIMYIKTAPNTTVPMLKENSFLPLLLFLLNLFFNYKYIPSDHPAAPPQMRKDL